MGSGAEVGLRVKTQMTLCSRKGRLLMYNPRTRKLKADSNPIAVSALSRRDTHHVVQCVGYICGVQVVHAVNSAGGAFRLSIALFGHKQPC